MLFNYQPEAPLTERLRFLTDIFVSKDGSEQRVNLRVAPRQEFSFILLVESAARQRIENILFGVQDQPFDIPIWSEPIYLEAAASTSATSISATIAFADFRDGGQAIIMSDENTFDVLDEIDISVPGTISFTTGLTHDYPVGTPVMPLRPALIVGSPKVSRWPVNLTKYEINFALTDNTVDLSDISAFSTLSSKPIVDDANAIQDQLQEGWDRRVQLTDSATGIFSQTSFWDRSRRFSFKTFRAFTRQRAWEVRQFLHWIRGQQKSFWLPTFGKDLTATANIVSGTAILTVVNAGYTDFTIQRTPRNIIRVVKKDGTVYTKTVLSSAEVDEDTETITVTSNWSANVTVADIERIEILEKVRMDSDDVEIIHVDELGQTEVGFPVKAVLE